MYLNTLIAPHRYNMAVHRWKKELVHKGYHLCQAGALSADTEEYTEIQIITDYVGQVGIRPEGYYLKKEGGDIIICAVDARGAMYGLLELAGQIKNSEDALDIKENFENPFNEIRAIKFNLP